MTAIRIIKIACTEDRTVEIPAVIVGNWAAHGAMPTGDDAPLVPRDDVWTVTYVPAGLCISSALGWCSAARAVATAEALSDSVPELTLPDMSLDQTDLVLETIESARRSFQ